MITFLQVSANNIHLFISSEIIFHGISQLEVILRNKISWYLWMMNSRPWCRVNHGMSFCIRVTAVTWNISCIITCHSSRQKMLITLDTVCLRHGRLLSQFIPSIQMKWIICWRDIRLHTLNMWWQHDAPVFRVVMCHCKN